jgi:epoxyqueuosine reductase QueG
MTLSTDLIELLKSSGADMVGFADLGELPENIRDGFPRGISIGVALDPRIILGINEGPTREYYEEYRRINRLLGSLGRRAARLLEKQGSRAQACAATNVGIDFKTHTTRLPHKTIVTRAGLGWIGKCALLVTELFGPAVRLTTVLTDAELPAGKPVNKSRCGDCTVCVDACPGKAPSGRNWELGLYRDSFFNPYDCRKTARKLARERADIRETICGICIAACPWTQKYIKERGI